jgi:phage shock protein B
MKFFEFMFVPTILFIVIVLPIWISMHYSSLKRSSRSLSKEDRETVDHMLETVDKLTERIGTLETLLDSDFPDWRQNQERRQHYDSNADRSH